MGPTVDLLLMSYLGIAISLWLMLPNAAIRCGTQRRRQSTQVFLGGGIPFLLSIIIAYTA
jgi:hypothetical protein